MAAVVRRVRSLGQRHSIVRMLMAQIPRSPILRHSVRRPLRVMHRGFSWHTVFRYPPEFGQRDLAFVDRAQHTHDHQAALMGFDSILPFAGFAHQPVEWAFPLIRARMSFASCILLSGRFHRLASWPPMIVLRPP